MKGASRKKIRIPEYLYELSSLTPGSLKLNQHGFVFADLAKFGAVDVVGVANEQVYISWWPSGVAEQAINIVNRLSQSRCQPLHA